eukprot:GHVO01034953.1.p1 GENE.GHVO01034953.1~~GHVO01034953.1.p1  ORF type:complete len:205 (-),score=6.25 GHVO01034953.1:66-626(-)
MSEHRETNFFLEEKSMRTVEKEAQKERTPTLSKATVIQDQFPERASWHKSAEKTDHNNLVLREKAAGRRTVTPDRQGQLAENVAFGQTTTEHISQNNCAMGEKTALLSETAALIRRSVELIKKNCETLVDDMDFNSNKFKYQESINIPSMANKDYANKSTEMLSQDSKSRPKGLKNQYYRTYAPEL